MDYSYKELEEDLSMGHEIEFIYKGEKYSITQAHNGWNFMKFYDYETIQVFQDEQDLLRNAKVGSDYLKDVWNDVKVTTVY